VLSPTSLCFLPLFTVNSLKEKPHLPLICSEITDSQLQHETLLCQTSNSSDKNYFQPQQCIYNIHCLEMFNLFVRALETGKKARFIQAFLASFTVSANKCTYPAMLKSRTQLSNCFEKSRNKR